MPFNPDQALRCGCIVATHTKTGNPAWRTECATARMYMGAMAKTEGRAWAQAASQRQAHAKSNGLR